MFSPATLTFVWCG